MGVEPDVSVVVIAHNEAVGIEDCLRALLTQATSLSYDVTVVDDGSTDGTADVVARLAQEDDRVHLIQFGVNRGRGAARLAGQRASSAPRLAFVDADIVVPPHWIATCADELQHGRSAVSGVAMPDGDCAVIWQLFGPEVRVRAQPSAITGNNVMFDARALEEEPFDEESRLGEDTRLASRMVRRGMDLTTIPTLVSEHREHKTYVTGIRWMFENGVDATRLPFELRRARLPDFTWLGWLACGVGALIAASLGVMGFALAAAVWVLATIVVDVAYMYSRFVPQARPTRWLVATACNLPLMTAYLLGRTAGVPLLARRRHALRGAASSRQAPRRP